MFAIDIPQPPCQTAFMGVDNAYGGQVAGEALGKYFKENLNCEYDSWVSLEQPEIGEPNEQRMGGYREGFEKYCGAVHDLKKVAFDASADEARTKMADTLTTLPNDKTIIVTSIDDEGIEGAFAAAKAAGPRGPALRRLAGHGRRHRPLRHQEQPELGRRDGHLPGEVRLGRHPAT